MLHGAKSVLPLKLCLLSPSIDTLSTNWDFSKVGRTLAIQRVTHQHLGDFRPRTPFQALSPGVGSGFSRLALLVNIPLLSIP